MSVNWKSNYNQPEFLSGIQPDNFELAQKSLPAELVRPLKAKLSEVELFDPVTRLSLTLDADNAGQIAVKNAETTQDLQETEKSGEGRVLDDIEDLGCPQFLESEVIVKSRVSSTCYLVQVETRNCIERKAAFATAETRSGNGFREFFNDLKLLWSARGCTGVAEFVGVVLDDTRLHLKSFIYESGELGSIHSIMTCADSKFKEIPWFIREIWAKQIINAVSDVHRKGLIVGGNFFLRFFGVRADGSAMMTEFRSSTRHLQNQRGQMAPELRNVIKVEDDSFGKQASFRTDIFHLSNFLWRLAEHEPCLLGSSFCKMFGCKVNPRYTCTAGHRNPLELPSCNPGVPTYFNDIIRRCRSLEPKSRPTARCLSQIMYNNMETQINPLTLRNIVAEFAAPDKIVRRCDECLQLTTDNHYRCTTCFEANFDLCPTCFAHGLRCLVPQHRMRKVTFKSGIFVEEGINDDDARSED